MYFPMVAQKQPPNTERNGSSEPASDRPVLRVDLVSRKKSEKTNTASSTSVVVYYNLVVILEASSGYQVAGSIGFHNKSASTARAITRTRF